MPLLQNRYIFLFAIAYSCSVLGCFWDTGKPRILVYTNEENALHESTPAAIDALQQLCADNNIGIDVRDIAKVSNTFKEKSLKRYAAVVLLNTAGNMLDTEQEHQFERYIKAGGGFVGIHTAIDTEHRWDWYGKLIGAHFGSKMDVQDAVLQVKSSKHPATQHFGATWQHRDEWFNLIDVDPKLQVLLSLDETSCEGGTMGAFHPVSWCHEFEGGRAFVTTMGHMAASYSDKDFLQHLLGGIQYAIGDNQPLKYENIAPKQQTESTSTGFIKTALECNLDEPMALDMLPNGNLVFVEREGAIKLYDARAEQVRTIANLPVFIYGELGILGMALDPEWEKNHWIYLYYSNPGKKEVNRLSRFVFTGDSFRIDSETVLLEVGIQRDECCHYAGCVKFDAQGYLYLSTGDNTDYDESEGYAPVDERPDYETGDAQRSSANSMDLRGKILRIKPFPDGSYLCPAGNLFTAEDWLVSPFMQAVEGTLFRASKAANMQIADSVWRGPVRPIEPAGLGSSAAGRPEIYVMGCRNPFRFSIDNRRGLLFWGEPGPQAGLPDSQRGPAGHDEINCAYGPGFFGWPYFIGNNKPYRKYDFEQKKPGPYFDPAQPMNTAPRNTGMVKLPPAQPALIWYSYASSPEFPLLANGANCAMAGPVYYCDQYPAESRFPDKFDGNLIIFDWMRNWVMGVALDSLGKLRQIQPLAESVPLSKPIDMLFDKNGSLWVLEYGTKWFSQNPDACLSRIDYIRGDGTESLQAGNAAPIVQWNFGNSNRSFYQPGEVLQYQIQASDHEDGSLADGRIQASDLFVHIDYLAPGTNWQTAVQNIKPKPDPFQRGKKLLAASDCASCHAIDRKINGPAYLDVARRYQGNKSAQTSLVQKIIKGGKGVWGETVMSAHPQLAHDDVAEIVRWILALGSYETPAIQGAYTLAPPDSKSGGTFIFHAAYKDRGSHQQEAQIGSETLVLRPAMQEAEAADSLSKDIRSLKRDVNGKPATVLELKQGSVLVFKRIDLCGIESVLLGIVAGEGSTGGAQVELRLDGPEGRLISQVPVPGYGAIQKNSLSEINLSVGKEAWAANGALHDLFLILKDTTKTKQPTAYLDWLRFEFLEPG